MLLWKKICLEGFGKKTCPAVPKNHHVTVQVGIFDDTNWCCSKLVLTPEFILLIPFVFKHTLGPDICESFATSSFLGGSHISIETLDTVMVPLTAVAKKTWWQNHGSWRDLGQNPTARQPLYDFDELRGKCHMFRSSQAAVDFWALRLDLGGKHGDMVLPSTAKEV